MIPTVLPARSAGERRCSEASAISPPSGTLHERHHRLRIARLRYQAATSLPSASPNCALPASISFSVFDRRARRDHAQVDALLPVVAGRQRAVDPGVHGVGREVEDQRRLLGLRASTPARRQRRDGPEADQERERRTWTRSLGDHTAAGAGIRVLGGPGIEGRRWRPVRSGDMR